VWRLSTKQISALIQALEIAKNLPETISKITSASEELAKINSEISNLDKKLETLNAINNQIIVINRNVSDLQKLNESQSPVLSQETLQPTAVANNELNNWEYVSKTWQSVKTKVEDLIDNLSDGRRRGKYGSMSRYNYIDVSKALVSDQVISEDQARALTRLDELFRRVKNQRVGVTNEMKNIFENDSKVILKI